MTISDRCIAEVRANAEWRASEPERLAEEAVKALDELLRVWNEDNINRVAFQRSVTLSSFRGLKEILRCLEAS